jgi:hypothetical protein
MLQRDVAVFGLCAFVQTLGFAAHDAISSAKHSPKFLSIRR